MRPKLALQHAEDYEKKKKIVGHLRNIWNYIKKNKIKRFILDHLLLVTTEVDIEHMKVIESIIKQLGK